VDCVVEVHDARIPVSGRNPILKQAFESKPYIVVLNKSDLIEVCFVRGYRFVASPIIVFHLANNVMILVFNECFCSFAADDR